MDPYRLPRTVVPIRYDLRLTPDLVAHTFAGEATITVSVSEATAEVVLNSAELTIEDVAAENPAGEHAPGTAITDAEAERARLVFDRPLGAGTGGSACASAAR